MATVYEQDHPFTTSLEIQLAFAAHLQEPSKTRISAEDERKIIQWLRGSVNQKPEGQKEYSRRNYVLKRYRWDEGNQRLLAISDKPEKGERLVIAEDRILDIVEKEHRKGRHSGWDRTWRRVRCEYSGITRSDIIFLLKMCGTCLSNPRKRSRAIQPRDENPAPGAPLSVQPFEEQLECGKGKGKAIDDTTDQTLYYTGNDEYGVYDEQDEYGAFGQYAPSDQYAFFYQHAPLGQCSANGEFVEFQDENSNIDPALFLSIQDFNVDNPPNAEASGSMSLPYAYETGESSTQ